MSDDRQPNKRTFKPLILFHNNNDRQHQLQDSQHQTLVEQHRLKTMQMLDYNSYLWENSSPFNNKSPESTAISGQAFSSALPDHYRHSAASASIPSEFSEDYTEQESPSRHSPVESVDKEEPKQKSMIGTTFIVEPRYHLVYNPNFGRKRKRENLPKNVTEYLKDWLIIHKKHPYPTEKEKQQLAEETGLTVSQISNWFINARRRILQPLLESESAYTTAPQASSSHHPIQHDNASYPHFSRYDNRNSSNNEYTTMADDTNHIVLNPYTNIAHDQDNKSKGKDKQH